MIEYTPNTKGVRHAYRAGSNIRRETPEQHYLGAPAPDYLAQFDRWLSAHDAEVAAKTLEDAANAFMRETDDPDECTTTFYAHEIEYWLHARAAGIRSEL